MNQKDINPIALALGITGALACSSAIAAENPFSLTELSSSQVYAGSHGGEGKCGEGNCGEGKCGEGKCGEDAKDGTEEEAPAEGEAAEEGEGEGEGDAEGTASEGEAAEEASE